MNKEFYLFTSSFRTNEYTTELFIFKKNLCRGLFTRIFFLENGYRILVSENFQIQEILLWILDQTANDKNSCSALLYIAYTILNSTVVIHYHALGMHNIVFLCVDQNS